VGKETEPDSETNFFHETHRWSKAVGFLFRRLWLAPNTPSHMTTIEIPTRMPEPALRAESTTTGPGHRVGLLTRAYREAGLSIEAARRCALADFRCCFPQYLTVV